MEIKEVGIGLRSVYKCIATTKPYMPVKLDHITILERPSLYLFVVVLGLLLQSHLSTLDQTRRAKFLPSFKVCCASVSTWTAALSSNQSKAKILD